VFLAQLLILLCNVGSDSSNLRILLPNQHTTPSSGPSYLTGGDFSDSSSAAFRYIPANKSADTVGQHNSTTATLWKFNLSIFYPRLSSYELGFLQIGPSEILNEAIIVCFLLCVIHMSFSIQFPMSGEELPKRAICVAYPPPFDSKFHRMLVGRCILRPDTL
jgi:hypothetical protein